MMVRDSRGRLFEVASRVPAATLALLLLCQAPQARAQGFHRWDSPGSAATEARGFAVAILGDVDGDGVADVIVGTPLADVGGLVDAGRVQVLSGASGVPIAALTRNGEAAGDRFGSAVAAIGTLPGDGFPDFIVGAPLADPSGLADAGRATVYSGNPADPAPGILYGFDGDAAGDLFGRAVAGAGFVDGDAIPDLVVGAPFADDPAAPARGLVKVFSGALGNVIYVLFGVDANDWFGYSVARAGRVDGDTRDDLIVGAPYGDSSPTQNFVGFVKVYSGASGTPIPGLTFYGTEPGALFGISVAGPGDLGDPDSVPDVVVGAPLAGTAGRVSAFSGGTGLSIFSEPGTDLGGWFGFSLAGPLEVNGGLTPELLIGAPLAGTAHAGRATIHSGTTGAAIPGFEFTGEGPEARLGFSVAAARGLCSGVNWALGAPGAESNGLPGAGTAGAFSILDPAPDYLPATSGCQGNLGVEPTIHPAGVASESFVPGQALPNFGLALCGAPAGLATALLLAAPPPVPIPVDVFVGPGCTLYLSGFLVIPTLTAADGTAFIPLPIPSTATATSCGLAQWYVISLTFPAGALTKPLSICLMP